MRKISLSTEADLKFQDLLKELGGLNPDVEKQTGPAVSSLICFLAGHEDNSLRQLLARAMTSPSGRKRAIQERLRKLADTDDPERLQALEKGLGRLEERMDKASPLPALKQGHLVES
jgi:hypothetical protein